MSRHGYTDDCEEQDLALWRGQVASAIRGKRGQAFLRRMKAALEAMPEKRLVALHIVRPSDGACCALGSVYKHEGIKPPELFDGYCAKNEEDFDEYDLDEEWLNSHHEGNFDIADPLVREIQYLNDECFGSIWRPRGAPRATEEERERDRYNRMLKWVNANLKEAASDE